jgi:hypothetical protein
MLLSRTTTAAAILALATAGAAACDDFDEELAVQATRDAAKLAHAAPQQSAAVPAEPAAPAPIDVAAAQPQPQPPATTAAAILPRQ